jgi:UDP-N-acetylglucosamine--N-acetylmuramyl-(pentapeptide) pyrophosphoryl-undecaprenol N-acetylglucosamine transferase
VRLSVERGDASSFRAAHGLSAGRPTVLVLGGSQGAAAITEAALGAARVLGEAAGIEMVIQAGERGIEAARAKAAAAPGWVRLVAFVEDMGGALAAADLVVSRAGATTLAELAQTGRPAILVPYPHAAEDHQRINAERYAASGAAEIVPQRELTPEALADRIERLTASPSRLEKMGGAARESGRAGARQRIADACESYLG